jgi:hypothetical protein
MAETELLPATCRCPFPSELQGAADALDRVLDSLHDVPEAALAGAAAVPDGRLRLGRQPLVRTAAAAQCAKAQLLMLDNPLIRLELMHDLLDEHGMITSVNNIAPGQGRRIRTRGPAYFFMSPLSAVHRWARCALADLRRCRFSNRPDLRFSPLERFACGHQPLPLSRSPTLRTFDAAWPHSRHVVSLTRAARRAGTARRAARALATCSGCDSRVVFSTCWFARRRAPLLRRCRARR